MSTVFAGCGYSFSRLNRDSKIRAGGLFKDLPCLLQMVPSIDRELAMVDQVVCSDRVFMVGTGSDQDVLDTLEMLRPMGQSVYQAQVTGRIASEELKLREGPIKVEVLDISAIQVKVEASFTGVSFDRGP